MKLLTTKQAMKYLDIDSDATFKTYKNKNFILPPHIVSRAGQPNLYRDIDLDRAFKPIANYLENIGIWGRLHKPKPIEYGNKQALFNQFLTNPKRKIA